MLPAGILSLVLFRGPRWDRRSLRWTTHVSLFLHLKKVKAQTVNPCLLANQERHVASLWIDCLRTKATSTVFTLHQLAGGDVAEGDRGGGFMTRTMRTAHRLR